MLSRNCSLSNIFAKVFTSQLLNSMDLITLPVHVFIIFWASKPWWYFHHCCITDDWETWERINQKLISWRHSLEARGGSWDSFGLFLVLARDLWHSTSAQLSCSLIGFVFHRFFSYGYVLTCSDWNDLISVYSLCISVFWPAFFEISLFGVVYVFTVLCFLLKSFPLGRVLVFGRKQG